MEFFSVVGQRRSVRKFLPEAMPEEVIRKALQAALKAPNSSNMQPWEFYWVRTPEKKAKLVQACFSQGAARTAAELIVVASRVDTWRRNRRELLRMFDANKDTPKMVYQYYNQVVPLVYLQDPLNVLGLLKWIAYQIIGLFRPAPRGPTSRASLFEMVTKTTALACENLMLALVAQGYASCPMEGFDECRVKKLLGLGRGAHVVMVIGCGAPAPDGIYGAQMRLDEKLFLHEV